MTQLHNDTQPDRHALMLLMRQGQSYFEHFLNTASTPAADLLELVLNEPRIKHILKLKHPRGSHGQAEGRREGFEHSTEHASEVMMEKIIIISHAVKYTTN